MMGHYLYRLNTTNSALSTSDMVQPGAFVVAMTDYPFQMMAVHKNACIKK
jgi:hypothetical protein